MRLSNSALTSPFEAFDADFAKRQLDLMAREWYMQPNGQQLLNFTWWVNKKDVEGRNGFQDAFLGLDNISVFDRVAPLPTGGGTSTNWTGRLGWDIIGWCCSKSLWNWPGKIPFIRIRPVNSSNTSCVAGKIIQMSSLREVIPWARHVNYVSTSG